MIELLQELRTAAFNIEAFTHFIMSQEGKKKANISGQKIESFLAYFMRILNSCVAELPIWLFLNTFGFFWK